MSTLVFALRGRDHKGLDRVVTKQPLDPADRLGAVAHKNDFAVSTVLIVLVEEVVKQFTNEPEQPPSFGTAMEAGPPGNRDHLGVVVRDLADKTGPLLGRLAKLVHDLIFGHCKFDWALITT